MNRRPVEDVRNALHWPFSVDPLDWLSTRVRWIANNGNWIHTSVTPWKTLPPRAAVFNISPQYTHCISPMKTSWLKISSSRHWHTKYHADGFLPFTRRINSTSYHNPLLCKTLSPQLQHQAYLMSQRIFPRLVPDIAPCSNDFISITYDDIYNYTSHPLAFDSTSPVSSIFRQRILGPLCHISLTVLHLIRPIALRTRRFNPHTHTHKETISAYPAEPSYLYPTH